MQNPKDDNGPRVLGAQKEANVSKIEGARGGQVGKVKCTCSGQIMKVTVRCLDFILCP